MADGSSRCLLLKFVLSSPSELGPDLLSFEFNSCRPVSWIQEDSKMADGSSGCCCSSRVKAVPVIELPGYIETQVQ